MYYILSSLVAASPIDLPQHSYSLYYTFLWPSQECKQYLVWDVDATEDTTDHTTASLFQAVDQDQKKDKKKKKKRKQSTTSSAESSSSDDTSSSSDSWRDEGPSCVCSVFLGCVQFRRHCAGYLQIPSKELSIQIYSDMFPLKAFRSRHGFTQGSENKIVIPAQL